MTFSVSTKTRGNSGASALAIMAGFAGGFALPANAQSATTAAIAAQMFDESESECALDEGTVTCAPGVDFDGFLDDSDDSLALDVQDGALVLSTIEITGTVTGNVDGEIVTEFPFEDALIVGDTSVLTTNGTIATFDEGAVGVSVGVNSQIMNNGSITTEGEDFADAVVLGEGSSLSNSGLIATAGSNSFAVLGDGDSITVSNAANGSIVTVAEGSVAISIGMESAVNNAGLIATAGDFAHGIELLDDGVVENMGTVETVGQDAVAINAGEKSSITNHGMVLTEGENAFGILTGNGSTVSLGENSVVDTLGENAGGVVILGSGIFTNAGILSTQGAGAQGVTILGDASVTNSGLIETANAVALDLGGTANVTNAAGASIVAGGNDAVRLSGDGSTLINRGSIAGEVALLGGDGGQSVINFGSLVGQSGDAVLLGNGADRFEQWTSATVNGHVDLESGNDTFLLEGAATSISGTIFGGAGNDLAIIAGNLDADNFGGFEIYQIGSRLGGTLNDAVITGVRTLGGDVTVVGDVALRLGVDTLTATGSVTLENGSTVNISTDRGVDLIGQTVLVLQDGTTFTDNGASINIVDTDLLIDYTPVMGSLAVQVAAANPLNLAGDQNLVGFGTAIQSAVAADTLSDANFAAFNALNADQLQAIALDALPALSEGAGREIFESSNAASEVLNRHLSGEGMGIWGEITVRSAEQDASSLTSGGYDSDQLIFTLGGDIAVGEMGRIGLLVSYADIENDDLSTGGTRGETEIESVKLGVYGALEFGQRGFVNGEIAYLTGDIESQRGGQLGTIGSRFDFDGFTYRAVAGFDLVANENLSVTPTVGINGAMFEFDDSVETGGFGFTVAREDADFTELRGGLEVAGRVTEKVSAFARAAYVYDLEDDARSFQLNSSELGSFLVSLPEREQDRFEVAAGAAIAVSERFAIELSYLGDFASGYDAHSARANLRFAF